jgi:hypothetical protein
VRRGTYLPEAAPLPFDRVAHGVERSFLFLSSSDFL